MQGLTSRDGLWEQLPQDIHRASDAASATVEYVGIDHRRAYIAMPQQLLDRPDVVAVFEEVRGEGMAEGMTGDMFF